MNGTEINLTLADMDEWLSFTAENHDELIAAYGSTARAYQHAIQGGLTIGGGAAPLFVITFAD